MPNNSALKAVEPMPIADDRGSIMEDVIAKGDLAKLSPEERARYYLETCKSLGINPLVKPFDYITLNGKLTLYATRTATDQLRSVKNVSIKIVERRVEGDLYIVVAQAHIPSLRVSDNRTDESTGAVNIAGLKGDALANAYMKAETKAKRRVTLSICGLGWMDETETETVREAKIVPVDTATGEILELSSSTTTSEPDSTDNATTPASEAQTEAPKKSTVSQMKALHAEAANRGLDHDDVHALAGLKHFDSITEMSPDQLDTLKAWIKGVRPAELDVWLKRAGRPTMDERLAAGS